MKKNIVKTFSTVFIITMIAKALGLLRDIIFAKYYGTGYEATAFFASIRIPTQLLDIGLSSTITSTFIPVFNELINREGKEKANKFANNFINIIGIITAIIAILGIIFAPVVVKLLAGGFDEQTFRLTVQLIKITFPMIIFAGIAFSFVGLLQSYGQFNIPAMISVVSNLVIILFLIIFKKNFSINVLAWIMLGAWAMQVIIQLPSAIKNGYKFVPKVNLLDENVKKIFTLALPIIISSSIIPINNLVATRIASNLGQSAVATLEYAYKIYIVVVGVFIYAIGNLIFPELSRLSSNNENEKYVNSIKQGIKIIICILLPLTVGFIIFSQDVISIIYERGNFDAISTIFTSKALLYYSVGMIGFGITEIMCKAFYAKQNTKTPLIVGIFIVIINIFLSIVLSKCMAINGLALATAITSIVNGITLLACGNKQYKGIIDKKVVKTFIKVMISTIIMGVCVYFINAFVILYMKNTNIFKVLRICIGGIIGVTTYTICMIILKVDEIKLLKKYLVKE